MQIIIYVLIALYILTVASVVFNVILENRNPVRTLAWIIVLVTVPLVGFLFYLYFGVNYRKNKMFSMKGLGDMKWLQYMSEDQKQLIRKSEFLKKRETVEVRKLMTLLLNNSKALLTRYNQVEILNNGEETFPALFGALKNAKKFIHLEYYIIGEGRLATELKEILLQKAAEGVEIRIIYDDVGSWSLSKEFIRELRKSDIQIYPFCRYVSTIWRIKPITGTIGKIAVVDGEVGFVGAEYRRSLYGRSTRNRHLERYPPESDRGSRDFVAGDFPDRLVFCPAGIVVG
ncbi:MAG: PLDc N-terminal domain-containing protein [Odoribacter splanchnicus]